jgi:hypothetical protein
LCHREILVPGVLLDLVRFVAAYGAHRDAGRPQIMEAQSDVLIVIDEQRRSLGRDASTFDVLAKLLAEPVLGRKAHDEPRYHRHAA